MSIRKEETSSGTKYHYISKQGTPTFSYSSWDAHHQVNAAKQAQPTPIHTNTNTSYDNRNVPAYSDATTLLDLIVLAPLGFLLKASALAALAFGAIYLISLAILEYTTTPGVTSAKLYLFLGGPVLFAGSCFFSFMCLKQLSNIDTLAGGVTYAYVVGAIALLLTQNPVMGGAGFLCSGLVIYVLSYYKPTKIGLKIVVNSMNALIVTAIYIYLLSLGASDLGLIDEDTLRSHLSVIGFLVRW